uniref:Uncharacterized protein n=1 Tax=Anopheles minimus TaxID=112268 RepID=A0A182WPM0_9DIPT
MCCTRFVIKSSHNNSHLRCNPCNDAASLDGLLLPSGSCELNILSETGSTIRCREHHTQ